MRAKPSSQSRSNKSNRNGSSKSHSGNPKNVLRNKNAEKKAVPDLSVLRQPVETSVYGLKQAVKVFETGTPEVLHLLTYDCDVVYECKVCRNLFRSIANFISHKRIYCTQRYSRSQDLQRSNKEADDFTSILGEKAAERLPTRVTARKDLTAIVDALNVNKSTQSGSHASFPLGSEHPATVLLEPIENTSHGVFQTVLKPDSQNLMKNQVAELHSLLSRNEVVLGPDGKVLQNGFKGLNETITKSSDNEGQVCSQCNKRYPHRKALNRHIKTVHQKWIVKTIYVCPCCKNSFAQIANVYRHLHRVHRKTSEQVRRLRSQVHKKEIKVLEDDGINESHKKSSPSKKETESEHQQNIIEGNKAWMDHFEEGDLPRCGNCGKKFDRKAAFIAHSQICQRRIPTCNTIDRNHQSTGGLKEHAALVPVVALSPLTYSKKPIPKPSPEKKIGIQVRMNYCKSSTASPPHTVSRQRSSSRSILGDESDLEAVSLDGRENYFTHGDHHPLDVKEGSVIQQFIENANNSGTTNGVGKLSSSSNRIDKVHTYEISTCRRSTVLRSSSGKSKNLEEKCLQLRSALEKEVTNRSKSPKKEIENPSYFDRNLDNSSESNTSAVSSLSSHLTPLVDRGFVCEVEQSIEIKNINISRSLKNSPVKEMDTSQDADLHLTVNRHTYKENIKFSPPAKRNYKGVSQSLTSTEVPVIDSSMLSDSSVLNDDEISVDLKPLSLFHKDSKHFLQNNELENTMYLTRNQLKAICKDDLVPEKKLQNPTYENENNKQSDAEVEAKTQEIIKEKFTKYIDETASTCKVCNKKFSKSNLQRHVLIHTQWKRFKCLVDGCVYQSFLKKTCLAHVRFSHRKEVKSEDLMTLNSLIGVIDPTKWNLRLLVNVKIKPNKRDLKFTHKKINKSKKNVQIVKNTLNVKKVTHRGRLKSEVKNSQQNKIKKNSKKLVEKVASKQRLITDFKNFNQGLKLRNKKFSEKTKLLVLKGNQQKEKKTKHLLRLKGVKPVQEKNLPPKGSKLNWSPSVNGEGSDTSSKVTEKTISIKKEKTKWNPDEHGKIKSNPSTADTKKDETVVGNHVPTIIIAGAGHESQTPRCETGTLTTGRSRSADRLQLSDSAYSRGKSSRASSRKSSVNSVDHHKMTNNSVDKVEETREVIIDNESPFQANFQAPEIADESSSLEEEESQESDRTVDDSHLKKIFMEVIFGPTDPSENQQKNLSGRPVRNKTRPKRDNDFILGTHKDSDRETGEAKSVKSRRSGKISLDSEPSPDSSKKGK